MILPPVIPVKLIRGDTQEFTASLVRNGSPYVPPGGSVIIFTAKLDSSADDEDSLFQKLLGYGLTVDDSTATISVVPRDTTFAFDKTKYSADIQVQEPDGDVVTAWLGQLTFASDTTRKLTTSVPIYTSNPPLPATSLGTPTYTHTQTVPSSIWTINHDLNAIVTVTVYDIYGSEIEAEVTNPTLNQTLVSFSTPTAGKARVT